MYESEEDERRGRDKQAPRDRRDDDRRSRDFTNGNKRGGTGRHDDGGGKRARLENNENDDSANFLMPFKKFLSTQDDDISEEDASKKYNEYKESFKKLQLDRFFKAHKDEEWFRQKYHPDESNKWKSAQRDLLKKRLEIYEQLKSSGSLDNVSLEVKNASNIIRILDTVIVKLEGGSEEDVVALKNEKIVDESIEEGETKEEESKPKTEEGAISDPDDNANAIHKTASIFLRNIPPSVTYEEIEAICKRSPGFLRVCLSEPIPERKFFRRGWATYKRSVNIKEICWNLNSIRIRDTDMNAIINRDLTRRIRTTNAVTTHKAVAQNDLHEAIKLIAVLDKRMGLFGDEEVPEIEREKDIQLGVDLVASSKNPLIKDMRAILKKVPMHSAEEEELLGLSSGSKADGKARFERDDEVLAALDQLVLYLRIVHSVDFYNHGDYPLEDHMPTRCGMMHVRAGEPTATTNSADEDGNVMLANKFVNDFVKSFNQQLEDSLVKRVLIGDEQLVKLGKKDEEKELEAFIALNTVELAKDKWLCPLSGKKFKGPEFIRKHLASKHEDRLDEVKHEVKFFNNYLLDGKRPEDVEVKPQPAPAIVSNDNDDRRDRYSGGRGGDRYDRNDRRENRPPVRGYGGYGGGGPQRDYGSRQRYFDGGGSRDPRPQVAYRDLDAPEDIA